MVPDVLSKRAAAIVLFALGLSSPAAAEICLDVDLRFSDPKPAAALIQSMRDEASVIWQPYGVRIQWSTTNVGRCASVHGSFDVRVDHQHGRRATCQNIMLGRTRVTQPAIDHAPIWVDQEAVECVLQSLTVQHLVHVLARPHAGPADVGRALGRILAHEIGHVILGTGQHQSRGLMRPAFLPTELIRYQRESYTLSRAELTRLRQRELRLAEN